MNRTPRRKQRGIATLLVLLMLGLVVGVATLGAFHVLGGTQQRSLTVHSTAPAQSTAWRGVELVRRYLMVLEPTVLEAWGADGAGLFMDSALGITARVTGVEKVPDGSTAGHHYRVTAQVGGAAARNTTAQTAATVQVVYKVRALEAGETPEEPPGTIIPAATINTSFRIGGTLDIIGEGGASVALNVAGDVKSDGNVALDGVDILRATGNVSLTSGAVQLARIHSNGDVVLEQGSSAKQIESRGSVTVSGPTGGGQNPTLLDIVTIRSHGSVSLVRANVGLVETQGDLTAGELASVNSGLAEGKVAWTEKKAGSAGELKANGNIDYSPDRARSGTELRSRGNITAGGGGASELHANGTVTYGGAAVLKSAHALGNLTLTGGSSAATLESQGDIGIEDGKVGDLQAEGSLRVGKSGEVTSGMIGGNLVVPKNNTKVNVTRKAGHTVPINEVAVVDVEDVEEVSTRVTVDVYPMQELANYVFRPDGDRTVVSVRWIAGVEDGDYWLVGGALCREPGAMDGSCADARTAATICDAGACILGTATGWTITANSLARGVMWFNGDLTLEKGAFVNTFMATGNIETKVNAMAPNYAGYDAMCTNAAVPLLGLEPVDAFARLVPTNLCDLGGQAMIPSAVANVVYLSGGYVPGSATAGSPGTLTGGDIKLNVNDSQARSTYGAVMAANDIQLTGNNTLHGTVTIGAQGSNTGVHWTGNTVIDLRGGGETYDPGVVPCMVGCTPPPPDPAAVATVLWSRYL